MAPVYPDINHLYSLYRAHPRVTTDTRHMEPGGIFFALSGPNFDGNAFAGQAIARGAVAAVVSDPGLTGSAFIHVEDPLSALQALARYHRAQLDIPVIGITGSNGKTTTKELLHRVLSGRYQTFATRGNLNNHIGVPLSLLAIDDTVEVAVIEMGANHVGEIRSLCSMARPTHGVITNIGQAHLEGFGGIEGIKRGKAELFDALAANGGVAFVHAGQPHLDDLSQRVARRVLYRFGDVPHCAQDSVVLVREKGAEQIALQV
ncbi:MAG: Mur ligase family protein, partial [Saprospiraceae bacterium]|nr:Mur ligase family protein [Saprospiraceae bacterium]